MSEWHAAPAEACSIDFDVAAGIAVEAVLGLRPSATEGPSPAARNPELDRLRQRIDKLEHVVDALCQASVWDQAAYGQPLGEEWLAIDRDHYQKIVDALAEVDLWRPWERQLERRLGDV